MVIRFGRGLKDGLVDALTNAVKNLQSTGNQPIVCVRQEIRPAISSLVKENELDIKVLGTREIVGTYVESLGEISLDALQQDSVAA